MGDKVVKKQESVTSQVNRLKSKASANTRSTQIAVSKSSGGLGLFTGDLVMSVACGIVRVVVGGDPPEEAMVEFESETVVSGTSSLAPGVASVSGSASDGRGTVVSGLNPPEVRSGKHSRFDFSQRGQTQVLDSAARRLRSDIGESIPPTPSAAFPRRGKNPCRPRIAVLTPQAGCHDSSW